MNRAKDAQPHIREKVEQQKPTHPGVRQGQGRLHDALAHPCRQAEGGARLDLRDSKGRIALSNRCDAASVLGACRWLLVESRGRGQLTPSRG